jgi:HSP20 family molecular chaperone IbpA
MFNKKRCKKCGKTVNKGDSFCANCGMAIKSFENEEDWGMLGRNDFLFPEVSMPGFNMIFNSLMKDFGKPLFSELEKDMKRNLENDPKRVKRGISISISTSGNSPPKIRINGLNGNPINQINKEIPKKKIEKVLSVLSEEQTKRFLCLPQEEPLTKIRRLSNKVIYEIELPGVKSLRDISIMQLEKSIELKALSKNKSYKKLISIDFPIQKYKLSKEKLILELGVKN